MLLAGRRRVPKRARRDRQGGGAAVEFALIMPLFLAVVCGMIDYGWYFYQRYALAAAIRDGIRNGLSVLSTATPPNDSWSTAKARAIAVLIQSNTIPTPSTSITWGPTAGGQYTGAVPNKALTLSAQYTFVPLIGFVPLPTTPMKYSMTMLLELEN
jgi:Flp pilus assembly protein TadG